MQWAPDKIFLSMMEMYFEFPMQVNTHLINFLVIKFSCWRTLDGWICHPGFTQATTKLTMLGFINGFSFSLFYFVSCPVRAQDQDSIQAINLEDVIVSLLELMLIVNKYHFQFLLKF